MTRLPVLTSKQLIKTLQKIGFILERQRGSHLFLKHPDGRATVIPIHKGEDIGRGLLRKIIRDIKSDLKDFLKLI